MPGRSVGTEQLSNMDRAQKRKARNRAARLEALRAEAATRGISVHELRAEKYEEVQSLRESSQRNLNRAPRKETTRFYW